MNHGKIKWIAAALALCLLALAGCGSTDSAAPSSQAPAAQATAAASAAAPAATSGAPAEPASAGNGFPIVETPITITWFYELDGKASVSLKSYAEMEAYKRVMEMTNINIEFQHPPSGQTTEQFNLMMASGDLADIVSYNWRTGYQGGAAKALAENLIMPLNDYLEEYAPNLWGFYQENPKYAADARTDEGLYYGFPDCSYEKYPRSAEPKPAFYTFGWQIRQDWVEKLGFDKLPETMDEWYDVLTAMRTQDPNGNGEQDEIPFLTTNTNISQWLRAWGLGYDYCIVDGQVKFGPYEPEYKDFLTTMNKWYEESLIDVDYVTNDSKQFDAKVTGDLAGSWTGSTSGTFGRLVQLMKARDESVKLAGTVQPYITGGKPYNFDGASFYPIEAQAAVISAKTKYPAELVRLLDFGYGEEGDALYNWGVEGESYTIDSAGNYNLTEFISSNPNGLSLDQALALYAPGSNNGPMMKSATLWNQRMGLPEQQQAVSQWSIGSGERILPPVSFTTEESSKIADVMNKVNTYRDEMLNKFIMGVVPMSEYDAFVKNLKDMGIEDAIAIYQASYERYLSR